MQDTCNVFIPARIAHAAYIECRKNISGKHRDHYRWSFVVVLLSVPADKRVYIRAIIARQIAWNIIQFKEYLRSLFRSRHGANQIPRQIRNLTNISIFQLRNRQFSNQL